MTRLPSALRLILPGIIAAALTPAPAAASSPPGLEAPGRAAGQAVGRAKLSDAAIPRDGASRPGAYEVVNLIYDGGRPPWTPADDKPSTGGHAAPFDIGRGTCNRELLGAASGGSGEAPASRVATVVIGAPIGGSIGQSMDGIDQSCVGLVLEHAANQRTVAWRNPESGAGYEVTPVATHQESNGRYCREYQSTAAVDGRIERAQGTACRQAYGSWRLAD